MTRPDLEAIRENWRHDVAIGSDVPTLLAYVEELEADRATLLHREVMLKRAHGALTDAGCVVPIEIDRTIEHAINALAERALTAEERLERVTHERDQERKVFEQAMAEALADLGDMRNVLKRVAASVGVELTALAEDASIAMHRGVLESCNRARQAAEDECAELRTRSIDAIATRLRGTVCSFTVGGEMVMVPGEQVAALLEGFIAP